MKEVPGAYSGLIFRILFPEEFFRFKQFYSGFPYIKKMHSPVKSYAPGLYPKDQWWSVLQIPAFGLFPFNRFEQGFKIAGAKALCSFPLDDFKK